MTNGWRDGAAAAVTAAGRVLIVGDPALSRGLMRMVLSRLGYVVVCVAGAAEARAALAHAPFALALVALRLPDAAGPAFGRGLRQAVPAGGGVPAPRVLLFGDAWDQDAVLRECGASGLDGYLPKPISIARLVASVRELTRPIFDPARAGAPALPQDEPWSPACQPPPVDLARLDDFTGGDDQIERELASLYLATAAQYLTAMRAALAAGGPWDRAAHSLKGASANLGAGTVAALAAEAEKAAPAPDLAARLDTALAQVRRFFDERAAGNGGVAPARELDLAG